MVYLSLYSFNQCIELKFTKYYQRFPNTDRKGYDMICIYFNFMLFYINQFLLCYFSMLCICLWFKQVKNQHSFLMDKNAFYVILKRLIDGITNNNSFHTAAYAQNCLSETFDWHILILVRTYDARCSGWFSCLSV